MTKEKTIEELEKLIKKVEFSSKWKVIDKLPFDDIVKYLNDYIDLLEERKHEIQI